MGARDEVGDLDVRADRVLVEGAGAEVLVQRFDRVEVVDLQFDLVAVGIAVVERVVGPWSIVQYGSMPRSFSRSYVATRSSSDS